MGQVLERHRMKREYTEVTCCHCKRTIQVDKPKQPIGWLKIEELHEHTSGTRPYEWWFCSVACASHASEILTESVKDGSEIEVPKRRVITELTCSTCGRASKNDALNTILGGSPVGGWITLERKPDGFEDHRPTIFHACSDKCLKKLELDPQPIPWRV